MLEIPPTFNSIPYFKLLTQYIILHEVCKRLVGTLGKHILLPSLHNGLWQIKKKRYNLAHYSSY